GRTPVTVCTVLVIAVLSAITSAEAQQTFTVDRLTDAGEGGGFSGDLRYCITNAIAGDTITFDVVGTINLTRALPELNRSISIEGPGADLLAVRRDTGGVYRIFTVTGTPTIVISGLTIGNGRAVGADAANGGPGQPGGNGEDGFGGGIYLSGGRLEINFSTLA